ncbi:MAG: DUF2807 domain-containing protein, partial [Bacteroidota bacterium]|nr:DUF2807 domain-containing protein [Bacteroidota bacterium]
TMKSVKNIALALIAGLVIAGCDWNGNQTIHGSGDVESMEVDIPAFEGVTVTGSCHVDIEIGEPQTVEFYAQSEVLDVLTYEVDDGILEISFKKGYTVNTSEEIRAEITISSVNYAGITGAGDFEFSGAQQELLDIYIAGAGNVDGFDMPVNDCNIRISGTGNCEVHVIDHLDVTISGVGNVWYRGNPTVDTNVSGVGNIGPAGN